MTSKQIILAAAMAFIAVPASATGNSSDQKSDKNSAASVDNKKYCIAYDNIVGSRVSRQECKTKAEWAKDRVDIDKMLKE